MSRRFDGEWMPWFGDWLLESERVEALSDGAYRLYEWLLWRQWKHESLPADPSKIAPGRFSKRWRALWGEVRHFFETGEDGRLRNETCAMLRADAAERRGKASERGKNGAAVTNEKRWGCRSTDRSSDRSSDTVSDPPPITPESLGDRLGPDRTGKDRTEQKKTPQPPADAGGADGPGPARKSSKRTVPEPDVDALTAPLPPELERAEVRELLASWIRTRRESKHPPVGPETWRLNILGLRGLPFDRALAVIQVSAQHGYRGIDPKYLDDRERKNGHAKQHNSLDALRDRLNMSPTKTINVEKVT